MRSKELLQGIDAADAALISGETFFNNESFMPRNGVPAVS